MYDGSGADQLHRDKFNEVSGSGLKTCSGFAIAPKHEYRSSSSAVGRRPDRTEEKLSRAACCHKWKLACVIGFREVVKMWKTLGVWWCRSFHRDLLWPTHGCYRCAKCSRIYPIRWEFGDEHTPGNDGPLVKESVRKGRTNWFSMRPSAEPGTILRTL